LSPAKTIYVFRCTGTGLYALTTDPTGHILPSRIYPRIRWRFERRVTVEKNSPKQGIVRATLKAIAKHGFYLTHKAIDAELAVGAVIHGRRGGEEPPGIGPASGGSGMSTRSLFVCRPFAEMNRR
jgi:hypothetical protein